MSQPEANVTLVPIVMAMTIGVEDLQAQQRWLAQQASQANTPEVEGLLNLLGAIADNVKEVQGDILN